MNVDRYRHNYEDFCEMFTNPKYINRERMSTTQGSHTNIVQTLLILIFRSWSRALKRKSNHLGDDADISKG